jgi:tRNA 5-methylaminomethyl-2-thiouridine biosynthesis bifunctional protein
MWTREVLDLVAARSAPGARAATFTVAGEVRRGLQAAGFEVAKRPGFGRKRERLEARLSGEPPSHGSGIRSAAVVGAGVAGACLSRALRRHGVDVTVIDPGGPGAGASGAPAALVSPRIDAGGGPIAALFAQAAERALEVYLREAPDAVLARGILRLEHIDRDGPRFDRIAAQDLWPDGTMTRLSGDEAAARLGEPGVRGALWEAASLVIEPSTLLARLLGDSRVVCASALRLEEDRERVRVFGAKHALIAEADAIFIAAGPESPLFGAPPMQPVRGQVSVVEAPGGPAIPFAWGGYAAPTRTGWLFGATHDRDDRSEDARVEDDARNLTALRTVAPGLAGRAEAGRIHGRASVRATTRDRLPVAGGLTPRIFTLTGLGSRGFLTAPLLAEHVAALALGAPSPLPASAVRRVEPGRPWIEFG